MILLEEMKEFLNKNETKTVLAVGGGLLVASVVGFKMYCKVAAYRRRRNYPKDVVILHSLGRSLYCPSLIPFAVKVETYFRMARIPYQLEAGFKSSSKGKMPWIEYNGEIVNDSSFIIQYFNKKLGIDLDKGLSPREKAIARAFQKMSEENLYWGLGLCRWVYYESYKWLGTPWVVILLIGLKRKVRNCAKGHGIGRHSQQEVLQIMEADIQALSDFLVGKKFIMGDDPTEVDSSIFGILSQLMWHSVDQPAEMWIKERYPNLRDYCIRMKELFWKDWDDCITHGGTREATR